MSLVTLRDGTIIKEFAEPYIIAEVNSSHNGNIDVAKQMVDAAKQAGCDCVKFQSWSVDSLYSKTYYDANPIARRFVQKLSLSSEQLGEIAEYCNKIGIAFSSTPYSEEEVDFLTDKCHVPFVKIASMEVNNPEYIRYIARKNVPIVISTGMADYEEVKEAISIIEGEGNRNIAILHCVSVYPTELEDVNLNNMIRLRKMFPDYPIGFSDHTIGDLAATVAVTMGAAVIEKHITLDSKKIGMDNQMAMEPDALNEFVKKCKSVTKILGIEERVLQPEELKQRENMRRSVIVTRDMKRGEILTREDLDVKRPGTGIAPARIQELVGKKLVNDVKADYVLIESDLDI